MENVVEKAEVVEKTLEAVGIPTPVAIGAAVATGVACGIVGFVVGKKRAKKELRAVEVEEVCDEEFEEVKKESDQQ